ncbi:carbamoyl-phosphate synthase (glutamine-hydrolyzing) large subunit [Sutcliffiella rhizosphaerae]|uniref:Carbamoyl phosphate synthase large chain n=1 Tax=Sutcliffiella rhizosphaerae TaxID=2880967 RepID=A0ABN8ABT7_9BACI|nr:carbamoyl-phosphate synthase (glutamine-hydrolyzing) large subunit [Sutcliffiella rhizosphaerae]CAG9621656.1 Carbamoyl-phosphate synthase large chain [Sutcliffiella rhizosphaerae]
MPLYETIKKVLVIGSGPIVIGQAAEFDYAGTQACLALREEGLEVILVNNNPATIMTDSNIADKVYMEPLNVECLCEVIKKERPDGIIGTLGGQTALNLIVSLHHEGILDRYNVKVLGTSVSSIEQGEDREKFRKLMMELQEPIPESKIINQVEDGKKFVKEIGYPVIIRPAYTLGGEGGGFAYNDEEFDALLRKGLYLSPIHQVLVEKSIKGWKEIEYEVMRDDNDTCIIVCNMENLDPVGVHTGDSIVVAPSQTLTDRQYQLLRNASLHIIRSLKIIGGCNIQFAMDPQSDDYYIIEVNPRVSRSSALASKATGYPIARIAAKCAIGYNLDEIPNPITGNTFASFEPALDYVVVKLPRFPFDKFPEADQSLSTQMKATGEVLAIDRSFEGALNKGIRSLEMKLETVVHPGLDKLTKQDWMKFITTPTHLRLFGLAQALKKEMSVQELHEITSIDKWFLHKINNIVKLENVIQTYRLGNLPIELLLMAKKYNISNKRLSSLLQCKEVELSKVLQANQIFPSYKLVDTCAAEFDAITPYYYSTFNGYDEVKVSTNKKALVIGSGPIRIGQGIEFDYCSVHAVQALKKAGYETIVVNNNPETVSTDFSVADKLYFEPITCEDILPIIQKEKVDLVFNQFGGQTAINLAEGLHKAGVNLAGTKMDSIDMLEERGRFYKMLEGAEIPHIKGITIESPLELKSAAMDLGLPVLVRPSYVIGGQSMFTLYDEDDLNAFIQSQANNESIWPLLVDQFIPGLECELDVISDGEEIVIPAIFEHIERAGVHSGDSIAVFPPVTLSEQLKQKLLEYTKTISTTAQIIGVANIQFVISEEEVFVLEVNPRASRTLPIVSKVTGIPMIELAVGVQLKEKLTNTGLLSEPNFWTVKSPVFSAAKLKDVDHSLGPEMKSTGEVIGMGTTFDVALHKALFSRDNNPFTKIGEKKIIFCSVTDREKQHAIPIFTELHRLGFTIQATNGTAAFINSIGIPAKALSQCETHEYLQTEEYTAAIIIPTRGRDHSRNGAKLRALFLKHGIKTFTHLDTVSKALTIQENNKMEYLTITDYLKKGNREVEYLCKMY